MIPSEKPQLSQGLWGQTLWGTMRPAEPTLYHMSMLLVTVQMGNLCSLELWTSPHPLVSLLFSHLTSLSPPEAPCSDKHLSSSTALHWACLPALVETWLLLAGELPPGALSRVCCCLSMCLIYLSISASGGEINHFFIHSGTSRSWHFPFAQKLLLPDSLHPIDNSGSASPVCSQPTVVVSIQAGDFLLLSWRWILANWAPWLYAELELTSRLPMTAHSPYWVRTGGPSPLSELVLRHILLSLCHTHFTLLPLRFPLLQPLLVLPQCHGEHRVCPSNSITVTPEQPTNG